MNPETKPRPGYTADPLLVFRAFAGLFVVVNHTYGVIPYAVDDSTLHFGFLNLSFLLNGAAQAGVYMFFCLSGYLMGKGFYARRYTTDVDGALSFYWSRFLRIVPLYVFYVGIALTIGAVTLPSAGQTYASVLHLLTFTYAGGPADLITLLGHLWTISTEVQFYLLVPFIMLFLLWRPPSGSTAVAALGWIAVGGLLIRCLGWNETHFGTASWGDTLTSWEQLVFKPLGQNLDLFVAGMMLNFVPKPKIRNVTKSHIARYFGAIALFYVVASLITHAGVGRMWSSGAILLWSLGLPMITLFFSLFMIWQGERLAYSGDVPDWGWWRHLVTAFSFIGTLTYGIYVWHVAFLNRPLPFLVQIEQISPLVGFGVALLTTTGFAIAAAAITYYGIEMRFDRYKRRAWWRGADVPRGALREAPHVPVPANAAVAES